MATPNSKRHPHHAASTKSHVFSEQPATPLEFFLDAADYTISPLAKILPEHIDVQCFHTKEYSIVLYETW